MSHKIKRLAVSIAGLSAILFSTLSFSAENSQTLNILQRLFNSSSDDHFTVPIHYYGGTPPSGYVTEGQQFTCLLAIALLRQVRSVSMDYTPTVLQITWSLKSRLLVDIQMIKE